MYRCAACGALNRVASGREGTPVCGKCQNALDISGAPQEVTPDGMRRAIASASVPVVVDFWAPWCGPCRMVAPIFERYARAHRGEVLVLKLNTEAHPEGAAPFGIRGIPTFIVFSGGNEVGRRSGAMPLAELERWLSGYVGQEASARRGM